MTGLTKAIALGAVQVAMVVSLGGKLLLDRATLPRLWVQTVPYDPQLPIRGRYLSLQLVVEARGFGENSNRRYYHAARVELENGKLVAYPVEPPSASAVTFREGTAFLSEPVDYFIPEHANDPSHRPAGEELWVEVTVPRKGPPRPIQLGVRKNGVITPLDLK